MLVGGCLTDVAAFVASQMSGKELVAPVDPKQLRKQLRELSEFMRQSKHPQLRLQVPSLPALLPSLLSALLALSHEIPSNL
jgi:hypothetical protein